MRAFLQWREGQPHHALYDEGYYGPDDGLEESRYVFLEGNGLPERLERGFTIAETGFGTGLNLLALAQLAHQRMEGVPLTYISVEKHPLERGAWLQCHRNWPEIEGWRAALEELWPEANGGWKRFELGAIEVHLYHGDIDDWFAAFPGLKVNAWFLDGFSPAKNPEMWRQELFEGMAHRSAPGASLATFTCAGKVRRGLLAAGFEVEKSPGFGRKKEMVRGRWPVSAQSLEG